MPPTRKSLLLLAALPPSRPCTADAIAAAAPAQTDPALWITGTVRTATPMPPGDCSRAVRLETGPDHLQTVFGCTDLEPAEPFTPALLVRPRAALLRLQGRNPKTLQEHTAAAEITGLIADLENRR